MDKKTFSSRSNAKRAADTAIGNGTAPSIDFKLHRRDDDRFEIVWKTAPEEIEADEFGWRRIEDEEAAPSALAPADPFPKGTRVRVAIAGQISTKKYKLGTVTDRAGISQWRVLLDDEPAPGFYTCGQLSLPEDGELAEHPAPMQPKRRARTPQAPRPKPASKNTATPTRDGTGKTRQSQYSIAPALIASGTLPESAPTVTSPINAPRYQPFFEQLLEMAKADDWDGVEKYLVTGINSYAKSVRRYQHELLALHANQVPDGRAPEAE